MKVIYVEDDAINAMVIKKFLSKYEVKIFTNGEDALEYCETESADLVLMDINLGSDRIDGVQCMKELRKFPHFQNIPVIAVTAYAMPEDRQRFLDEGFDDYFSKPVNRELLTKAVESYEKVG